jgi:hypothetical protein
MGRSCSSHGRGVECGQGFEWRTKRKGPLGTDRHRWEDSNKIDIREMR